MKDVLGKIKKEVDLCARYFGTVSTIKKFTMKYPKFTMEYSFVRATVNSWIKKCKDGENRGIKNVGKSNLVDTSLLKKVKNIPLGTRLFGSVIYKHQLISIATGIVTAKNS